MKNMKWMRSVKSLPVIPDDEKFVMVLAATFDPSFEALNPGKGYSVDPSMFDGTFKKLAYGSDGMMWVDSVDDVQYWTVLPSFSKKVMIRNI